MPPENRDVEQELTRLKGTNVRLNRLIEQLRRKFAVLQRSTLAMNNAGIVPADHVLAELAPIETVVRDDATVTIIAFSGMLTQLGMPPRQFFRTIAQEACNIIFVKDFDQNWYQSGLMSLSNSLSETVDVLRGCIPPNTRHLRTLGTSSGGFAAIYFGAHLGAERMLAFGPQTKVRPIDFRKFGSVDSRSEAYDFEDPENDLSAVLKSVGTIEGRIEIFFAAESAGDRTHAERLAFHPAVELRPVADTDSHNVAGILRERGELRQLLLELARP